MKALIDAQASGLWLLALLLAASLGYNLRPWLSNPAAELRAITPRGDLAADEQNTIAIFIRPVRRWCLSLRPSRSSTRGPGGSIKPGRAQVRALSGIKMERGDQLPCH